MKIGFVFPGFSKKPVGGFRVVYEYANGLVKRGHEVCIIYPRFMKNAPKSRKHVSSVPDAAWMFLKKIFPPKLDWHELNPHVRSIFIPKLEEKYLEKYDVILATAWWTAEALESFSDVFGKKLYLIQHYEAWGGEEERLKRTWLLPFHKIVIAKWLFAKGKELGVSENDMSYIPNGMNLEKYKIFVPVEKRKKRIAMLYHTLAWKGSGEGIEALLMLRKQNMNFEAVLFGVDERPKTLPEWIEYRKNPSQKELTEDIYNESSIFLSPSWTEGWPLPPAEAMACGCALVATSCTGIDEYAENEKTALLSDIKNPQALAENLKLLFEHDVLRIQLAKAGNEYIQNFTWEKSVEKFEEVCGKL